MSHDIISDALNGIMNAKKAGKLKLEIKIVSKVLVKVLDLIKKEGLIDYKLKGKELEIEIISLNECRTIKPRFNVKTGEIEKYKRRFLPAREVGTIIVSTSKGLMSHEDALEQNLGGSLIAYYF